jgi:hypothetical protein
MGSNQEITAYWEKLSGQEPYVIINEINYHSSPDFNSGDWIEIHNKQKDQVDVSGWKLKDSNNTNIYQFPVGTKLSSYGYLTICEDIRSFHLHFPFTQNCIGNTGFGLGNEGDVVRLYNADDVLIDSVRYDDTLPWPESADGEGYSMVLTSPDLDNDLPENWTTYQYGNPGRGNKEVTAVPENDIETPEHNVLLQNFPNPASSSTTISYTLVSRGDVSIKVYNLYGEEILTLVNDLQDPGSYSLEFNVERLNDGIYFYVLKVGSLFVSTRKIVVMH